MYSAGGIWGRAPLYTIFGEMPLPQNLKKGGGKLGKSYRKKFDLFSSFVYFLLVKAQKKYFIALFSFAHFPLQKIAFISSNYLEGCGAGSS